MDLGVIGSRIFFSYNIESLRGTTIKRFIVSVSRIWIGATVLCAIAVLIWRLQANPDLIPDLSLCDGVPCYRGITLNKTTLAEAKRIFANAPGFALNPDDEGGVIANGPIQTIIPFAGN